MVGLAATVSVDAAATPTHVVKAETSVGYHSPDYSTLDGGAEVFAAETVAVVLPTPDWVGARLDVLGGALSGGTLLGGFNAHLYLNRRWGLAGLSVAQVWLSDDIHTTFFGLTGAVYEDELLSVCLNAGYEDHSFGQDLWFGELFLRLYPGDRWSFTPGVSYVPANLKQTRADILLRLEFIAMRSSDWSLGLYAQYGGNLFTKGSAGLTLYFDGTDMRTRDRTWGPAAPRFK